MLQPIYAVKDQKFDVIINDSGDLSAQTQALPHNFIATYEKCWRMVVLCASRRVFLVFWKWGCRGYSLQPCFRLWNISRQRYLRTAAWSAFSYAWHRNYGSVEWNTVLPVVMLLIWNPPNALFPTSIHSAKIDLSRKSRNVENIPTLNTTDDNCKKYLSGNTDSTTHFSAWLVSCLRLRCLTYKYKFLISQCGKTTYAYVVHIKKSNLSNAMHFSFKKRCICSMHFSIELIIWPTRNVPQIEFFMMSRLTIPFSSSIFFIKVPCIPVTTLYSYILRISWEGCSKNSKMRSRTSGKFRNTYVGLTIMLHSMLFLTVHVTLYRRRWYNRCSGDARLF